MTHLLECRRSRGPQTREGAERTMEIVDSLMLLFSWSPEIRELGGEGEQRKPKPVGKPRERKEEREEDTDIGGGRWREGSICKGYVKKST